MLLEPPRGMDDLLPREFSLKQMIVDVIRKVYEMYGYMEVETPTVEYYELFELKSGEEIRERMFDFYDKSGRRCVLRPEVTASIARLMATKFKNAPLPLRIGYIADCYRYDEPQWGRKRRFWQGGFELFGSRSPLSDVEILMVSYEVFKRIGLREQFFKIGHVGIMRNILESYKIDEKTQDKILTSIDRRRIDEAYTLLRELGIDEDGFKTIKELVESPPIIYKKDSVDNKQVKKIADILSPWNSAEKSFENLIEIVELAISGGVDVEIQVIPGMARGLEYYTGFIFEQGLPNVEISFNGGGRYDKLVELFGGKPTPAVGCAIGISRIMQYMIEKMGIEVSPKRPRIMLAHLPEVDKKYVVKIASMLRSMGIPLEIDVMERKLTSILEYALKNEFKFLVIIGKTEEEKQIITLRDLDKKIQVEIPSNEIHRIREMIKE
ncbi:MAG: histidine--tRNA ligase [Nitrososphaerota archaeon]|nr:histidine--tRNA ligase [Candidatus Geocrenenecus dongiae]